MFLFNFRLSEMSTVVSETITAMENLRFKEKPTSKLIRTSSLERIKEFNTYICAHNYFFVPTLLNWLKTSQNGLESNLDVFAAFYRHLLYNILLYKVIEFKLICKGCVSQSRCYLFDSFMKLKDSEFLFKFGVHVAVLVVSLEVSTCFYWLFAKAAPVGLLFLTVCCLWSVVFLLYEGTIHFEQQRRKWNERPKSKTN